MTETFLTNFKNRDDVINAYNAPVHALKGAKVYVAWYGNGSYDGTSFVLFKKDGKLYEVNGCHCSCYGLEDQWHPEETSWEALAMRTWGTYSDGETEVGEVMGKLLDKYGKKAKATKKR